MRYASRTTFCNSCFRNRSKEDVPGIEPYCSEVLKRHWPDVPNLGDITKVDWNGVDFGRPDIPIPLIRGKGDGPSRRLDNYIRIERTKVVGNSVVPQVAQVIGEMILMRCKT